MYTKNPYPGKYEGNTSRLLARILDNCVGNGYASDELGDVDGFGHYALVLGRRYTFTVYTSSQGFVDVQTWDKAMGKKAWADINLDYEKFCAITED